MMLDVWNMYYYLIIWLICFCLQCGHSCTIRGIRNSYFTTDNSISSIPTTTPFCSFAFQTDSPVTLSTEYLRPLTGSTNVSSTKSNSTLRTLVFKELLLLFLNALSVLAHDILVHTNSQVHSAAIFLFCQFEKNLCVVLRRKIAVTTSWPWNQTNRQRCATPAEEKRKNRRGTRTVSPNQEWWARVRK